jgi:hypothetical protein
MSNNNRIFYACQAVAISPLTTALTNFVEAHGVQSVGLNTTFNLEQVFELGQIEIYENIEGVPDVEVTLEKVLDGYPLLYRLATAPPVYSALLQDNTLVARTKNRCSVALAIYPDDKNVVLGTPPVQVYMSGMYLNNVSYTLPVDGNCTESVTLVGNHKEWFTNNNLYFKNTLAERFRKGNNPDFPINSLSTVKRDGVQRRENVLMNKSVIPTDIYGVGKARASTAYSAAISPVSVTGIGNNYNTITKTPIAHIQNITISSDLGREDILELGQKMPYYRAPNFPVEVSCEFEVISVSGDFINALEAGDPLLYNAILPDLNTPHPSGNNTAEQTIYIEMLDGTAFFLGKRNRLSSVTYGGADAGGGNASMTYSYTGYNDLLVVPPGTVNPAAVIDAAPTNSVVPKPLLEPPLS